MQLQFLRIFHPSIFTGDIETVKTNAEFVVLVSLACKEDSMRLGTV